MINHIQPILTAFLIFLIVAFVVTTPWTIYQYRKHGYFSFWRNLILFSFVFYLLTAFFLVSLPLPVNRENFIPGQSEIYSQLKPFRFISDITKESEVDWLRITTYKELRHSPAFFQFFFNLVMLLPLGVYYKYYKKNSARLWKAACLGFLVSLFFEVSQITALFGYYQVPYRLFDVDDLFANTLGAVIGYLLAPLFLFFLPSRKELVQKDQPYHSGDVTSYGIQIVEALLTMYAAGITANVFAGVFGVTSELYIDIIKIGGFFLYSVIVPIVCRGYTISSWVLRIRFDVIKGPRIKVYIKRFSFIYIPVVINILFNPLTDIMSDNVYIIVSQVIAEFIILIVWIAVYANVLWRWLRKKNRPYFNNIEGLRVVRSKG
ncbi:VanZ family protein [Vagococcus coleopterorum]|uniref:VanZ family protein n=1 Tax=Vagococcus coleopterorum TaxID=2714946 RepID=A0A6G8AM86_9ENTE|nr:VanZ family protein [Vagococcus coleopterorum]QIL46116.1 VanZ family protein [Vagococcus coleopterorum]